MSILIDQSTRVLIQGITGTEGARACKYMKEYGTQVVAGVTPGKGGQLVEGVPVYDTVAQAKASHGDINASLIVVPAHMVKDATAEAIASQISLINILTEYVPPRDTSVCVALAKRASATIIGPASIGIISPGKAKLGSIGSGEMSQVFSKGNVGVISKSGGMTAEIAFALTQAGIGQSTVIGMGGDMVAGSDYIDILKRFADDTDTKAIVLFCEVGGTYEEDAAQWITQTKFPKPVIALVGGKFATHLPTGVVLGHAGAIVSAGKGGYESKVQALQNAHVHIVQTVEEIPDAIRRNVETQDLASLAQI